jgi:hypothetical protein
MTTTPGDGDDANTSNYTDMQIHDDQLPEDLQPGNELDASDTDRSEKGPVEPGDEDQLGQVPEGTATGSDGDAAAADAPTS